MSLAKEGGKGLIGFSGNVLGFRRG